MNVIQAAHDTLSAARVAGMGAVETVHYELSYRHLTSMVANMSKGDMPEDKMNRYLGWIQAAVVASSRLTLEDMKKINRDNA